MKVRDCASNWYMHPRIVAVASRLCGGMVISMGLKCHQSLSEFSAKVPFFRRVKRLLKTDEYTF